MACYLCALWWGYPYSGNPPILKGGMKFVPDYLNWPMTLPTMVVEGIQVNLNSRVVTDDQIATDVSGG